MTNTLANLLEDLPGGPAVWDADGPSDRGELLGRVDGLVVALREAGVRPNQVVSVMVPNRAVAVVALFAVWRIGAVYNPLNPRASDGDVRSTLGRVRPAAVVTARCHAARFPGRLLVVEDADGWSVSGAPDHDIALQDDGVALVQFTSGTTGHPKAVPMSHATVLDLIDRVLGALRGTNRLGGDKTPMPNLVPVSLSLWGGIYQILFAFRAGAPVIVMDHFDTLEFTQLVQRHRLRSTVLPPAALTMLVDDDRVQSLAPLKRVRSITAPLAPTHARRFFDRFGVVVMNAYGQTELGGEVVGWTPAHVKSFGLDKLGSVGKAHAGVLVRVADEEGSPLPAGDVGELWIQTPSTSAGEVAESLLDRLSPDGWFRTGDLGYVDHDGFVWVTGRVSDMINRGGLKVYPDEVEDVLTAFAGVKEASVVGASDDRLGEVPFAFVVTDGSPVTAEDLLRWSREHLSPYKVPVGISIVGDLPRNEVGKVLKRELVAQLRAGQH